MERTRKEGVSFCRVAETQNQGLEYIGCTETLDKSHSVSFHLSVSCDEGDLSRWLMRTTSVVLDECDLIICQTAC